MSYRAVYARLADAAWDATMRHRKPRWKQETLATWKRREAEAQERARKLQTERDRIWRCLP